MGPLDIDFSCMVQQFSWGHFLIASIVLNLVWYVFVALVFYRGELMAFLGGSRVADPAGEAEPKKGVALGGGADGRAGAGAMSDRGNFDQGSLMGSSRLPEGVEVKSSSEVSFSAGGVDRLEQVGLVADLVQGLKEIFARLATSDGGKPEFFRLVSELKEELGGVSGHPSLGAVNGFVREHAPFALSEQELEDLWY